MRQEEVYGAIARYLANQSAVDDSLAGQGQGWAERRLTSEPLPAGLRQRLTRARGESRAHHPQ